MDKRKELVAKANFAAGLLACNGFLTLTERDKVHKRILRYRDKNNLNISPEMLESVDMICGDDDGKNITKDRIVLNDGFVWKVLTRDEAISMWKYRIFPMYIVRTDDEEEIFIDNHDKFSYALSMNLPICIGVGKINLQNDQEEDHGR